MLNLEMLLIKQKHDQKPQNNHIHVISSDHGYYNITPTIYYQSASTKKKREQQSL